MAKDSVARGLAASGLDRANTALLAATAPFPAILGLVGDSRNVAFSVSSVTYQKEIALIPTWFEFASKGRFKLATEYCFAVGGTLISAVPAQMASLIAVTPRCSHVLILTGTNTFNGGNATEIANAWPDLRTSILLAVRAGIQPIVILDLPRQQSTFSPGATAGIQSCYFNELIRRNAPSLGAEVIDLTPTLADPASATGDPFANYYSDGIHPAPLGASRGGIELAAYFAGLPKPYRGYSTLRDTYDATNNPSGNLLTGGLMQGAGGTNTGTGASGTVPTGWKNVVNGGSGTSVSSVVARTDGGAGNWMQLVIASTGANSMDVRITPSSNITTNYAAGDRVVFECDIEVESGTAIQDARAGLTCTGAAFSVKGRGQIAAATTGQLYPAAFTGKWITPPAIVTSDTTSLDPVIYLGIGTAGGGMTARVGAISVRKV